MGAPIWESDLDRSKENMIKTTLILCLLMSVTSCITVSTTTQKLKISGTAKWIENSEPKAKLDLSVYAKINGKYQQIANDTLNVDFPFETSKHAIDAPDWRQDGEIDGWWYIRPDNVYEPSTLMIKAEITKPVYFKGITKEIEIEIE